MRMTASQYWRLCLVLFLPLIIASYLFSKLVFPYPVIDIVLCNSFLDTETCRNVGPLEGPFYKLVRGQSNSWIEVQHGKYDADAFPKLHVEASGRMLRGARILQAEPFSGYPPEINQRIRSLEGMPAIVLLVSEPGGRSTVGNGIISLYCNSLWFGEAPGAYSSRCFGDGWSTKVTYSVMGADRQMLDNLANSINLEAQNIRNDYRLYQVVIYPLFLYLFLIISALIWITIKAVNFVKGGLR